MTLDPNLIDQLLEVLNEHGATEFSCPEFSIRLSGRVAKDDTDDDITKAIARREAAAASRNDRMGTYSHPSLWVNGAPPSFPGVKKTEPEKSPYLGDE